MSASLLMGTRRVAVARVNASEIQLSKTASILNSLSIAGSAMLTDEPMNGTAKFVIVVTISATFFVLLEWSSGSWLFTIFLLADSGNNGSDEQ